jgi:prophage DNA circulation protein
MPDDTLSKLRQFEWRGIPLPLTNRQVSFESEAIQHTYQFRDGEFIEAIGTRNLKFSYSIPFREALRSSYKDLYTKIFSGFVAACQDRTEGPLVDPVFGKLPAKFLRFSSTTDPNRRDGEDVQVEFVHAPPPFADEVVPLETPASLAAAAVSALAIFPPELETPDIGVDFLTQIANIGASIQAEASFIAAKLEGVVAKLEAVEEQLVELADPTEWQSIRNVRSLQGRARDLAERVVTGRAIVQIVTSAPQTIASLAAQTGMSPQDVLRLNPGAARTPTIPPGTVIKYFQEAA